MELKIKKIINIDTEEEEQATILLEGENAEGLKFRFSATGKKESVDSFIDANHLKPIGSEASIKIISNQKTIKEAVE